MLKTLDTYQATNLGLPYPVMILNGVEAEIDDETGEQIGISIPDLEEMVLVLAASRALAPIQLLGSEVRFMRRAVGMTQQAFADAIACDVATLSRWETGKAEVGEWADRSVRMSILLLVRARLPGIEINDVEVVNLRIIKHIPGAQIRVELEREIVRCRNSDRPVWSVPTLLAA